MKRIILKKYILAHTLGKDGQLRYDDMDSSMQSLIDDLMGTNIFTILNVSKDLVLNMVIEFQVEMGKDPNANELINFWLQRAKI